LFFIATCTATPGLDGTYPGVLAKIDHVVSTVGGGTFHTTLLLCVKTQSTDDSQYGPCDKSDTRERQPYSSGATTVLLHPIAASNRREIDDAWVGLPAQVEFQFTHRMKAPPSFKP
jgi:hypothetical protein